jgi:hypothetical protein
MSLPSGLSEICFIETNEAVLVSLHTHSRVVLLAPPGNVLAWKRRGRLLTFPMSKPERFFFREFNGQAQSPLSRLKDWDC